MIFGFPGPGPEVRTNPEPIGTSRFEVKLAEAFALYDKGEEGKKEEVEEMLKEAGQILAEELKANANSAVIGGEQISYIPEKTIESPTEPYDEKKKMRTGEYPKFQEFEGAITNVFPEDKRWMVRVTAEAAIEAMKE